ncbi:unnamed protein product [Urochloa decumbens]|uniref:F-box domain-containing protein n=1 Tax=Urochloa decumbens TaxID=240449 RepID=A0ABC9B698_9POAL
MVVVIRAKKRRLEEEEEECLEDRISRLPDDVLGDIVSLLPTRDGARTLALSSRWRHIWRSAPLNFALDALSRNLSGCAAVPAGEISRILAAHHGPWLRSPALDGLQELEFHCGSWVPHGRSPPPTSLAPVRRFSMTLCSASFGGCAFPAADLHLPVLKQLSLVQSTMSETSVLALLAGCPVLESLLLFRMIGFSCLTIVSSSLRSIAVHPGTKDKMFQWLFVSGGNCILQHLVLQDAPCLERLLLFSYGDGTVMDISVVLAPKLGILGALSDDFSRVFQDRALRWCPELIKILALVNWHLRLDVVINFLKCFPCLEKLCVKTTTTFAGHKNEWGDEYSNLVSALDIRVKKLAMLNYQGNTSHINFAKFFVLNARVLESMVIELETGMMPSTEWIEKQHERLHTKNRDSSGARFDFVPRDSRSWMHGYVIEEQSRL